MPSAQRATDHSIVAGMFTSIAAYNAATPSVIANLPTLADMVSSSAGLTLSGGYYSTNRIGAPLWTAPNLKSVACQPARIVQYMNGLWLADGFWSFTWQFNFWTNMMMNYFLNKVLGVDITGLASNAWSVAATAKTYLDYEWFPAGGGPGGFMASPAALYLYGYVAVPVPGKDCTIVEGGFKDVKIRMTEGTPFNT